MGFEPATHSRGYFYWSRQNSNVIWLCSVLITGPSVFPSVFFCCKCLKKMAGTSNFPHVILSFCAEFCKNNFGMGQRSYCSWCTNMFIGPQKNGTYSSVHYIFDRSKAFTTSFICIPLNKLKFWSTLVAYFFPTEGLNIALIWLCFYFRSVLRSMITLKSVLSQLIIQSKVLLFTLIIDWVSGLL